MLFYAIFPFIAAGLAATPRARLLLYASLVWLGLAAAALSHSDSEINHWGWIFYGFPITRLIDFFVGVLFGLAAIRPGGRLPGGTFAEFAALGAVGSLMLLSPAVPNALRSAALLMPAWVLVVVVFAQHRGRVSRALSQPWCVRLGEASFAFYLLQLAVIEASKDLPLASDALRSALDFAVTTGLSLLIFRYVEEPMRRYLRTRLAPGRAAAEISATT